MTKIICRILSIAFVAALAGCGGKPMPFPVPESEMGTHPGLFTGESGAWQLNPTPAPPPPSSPPASSL